jgi:hypothetical protein
MEPRGSLLCSQEPATGPCPEPDCSRQCYTVFILRPILILSSHLCLDYLSGLIRSSSHIVCMAAVMTKQINTVAEVY